MVSMVWWQRLTNYETVASLEHTVVVAVRMRR